MKRSDIIHAAIMTVCMIVIMFASTADAHASSGYTMSKIEAQSAVEEAAEYKYERWDVTVLGTACAPQYVNKPQSYWRKYTWHRWKCAWVGIDENGDDVWGGMRITGHSNGTYGYLPLAGGLHWGTP